MRRPSVPVERRTAPRHRIAAPVRFPEGSGITRDLGTGGIFFVTDTPFAVGQPVELTVALCHVDPERPTELECRGSVSRVERPAPEQDNGPMYGVAVIAVNFAFVD